MSYSHDRGEARGSIMRVLFLDIDGVLNSSGWMAAGHMRDDVLGHFAPHLCARLERVLAATNAVIVVSSSWRIAHSDSAIQHYLRTRGVPSARVIGSTPTHVEQAGHGIRVGYESRGHEIVAWLRAHPQVASFAIVDDSDDMGPVKSRLVRTSWARGIEDVHVDRLIALLMEGG